MHNIKLEKASITKEASPLLYGLFFEDINCAADGGMNAELVSNNSFEFEYISYNPNNEPVKICYDKLRHWATDGGADFNVLEDNGMNKNNPSYLHANVRGVASIKNCGYPDSENKSGIALENGTYKLSFYARNKSFNGKISVWLESKNVPVSSIATFNFNSNSQTANSVKFVKILENTQNSTENFEKTANSIENASSHHTNGFVKYEGSLTVLNKHDADLIIELDGNGTLDLDYFSLMGGNLLGDSKTWKHGRIKSAFAEVLRACNPKFIRFPGGCIVEGDADFSNMYMWKNTVGELAERRQNANTWEYMQSYAIGFYEYFLLCEELGAEPLPILPLGMLCQIRCGMRGEGDRSYKAGTKEFEENVIDNIAHLIYFALGDVNSPDSHESFWANVRAKSGHEAPFNMRMIGLGNENWGKQYFENLDFTLAALREYPHANEKINILEKYNLKAVASCGVDIRPQDTAESSKIINQKYPHFIIDEHCYNSAQWFIDSFYRYDVYDRRLAKVFMGEYGMHTNSDGRGRLNGVSNLKAALSEAVFLTGCERNSDVVSMTAYAPLFAKTMGYRWTPDLIWFDNRQIMRTPSYFIQQMFASNMGTHIMNLNTESICTAPNSMNNGNQNTIEISNTTSNSNQNIIETYNITNNNSQNTIEMSNPTNPAPSFTDIKGGLFAGVFDSEIIVESVKVSKNGKAVYFHDFRAGLGEWKQYPCTNGGTITKEGLLIKAEKSLNGYYLDGDFGDCRYEFKAKRLSGNEGIICGIGLDGVKDNGSEDRDMHSLWLNYGAQNGKIAFEKRYGYMRVAYEVFDELVADYNIDALALVLDNGKLTALKLIDGCDNILYTKLVHRTHEKLFLSATASEDAYYLKAVNIDERKQKISITTDMGTLAQVTTLEGKIDCVNKIDAKHGVVETIIPTHRIERIESGRLVLTLPKNSATTIKIT